GWLACTLLVGAQQAEQAPHLAYRLATGALNLQQRVVLAPLILPQDAAHRTGLHAHHADAVGDHIVQLPCDPPALLGDGSTRMLIPSALELRGSRVEHL